MEEEMILEQMEDAEVSIEPDKKTMKKDMKRIGWGLIWYTLINLLVVTVVISIQAAQYALTGSEDLEQYLLELENTGTSMIIGVCVGVLFLSFFLRKKVQKKDLFAENKKMTSKEFVQILCVFMTAQFTFSMFASLLEAALNVVGYSSMESIEAATGGSLTFSMFLYASFVGPVIEEIVYRGFLFRALRKYGKMFAIVTSALLFGIMHANLPQMAFAAAVGFVLAYVTEEYSIKWAIALHVINNFVFAELLSFLGKFIGETTAEMLSGLVVLGFFVAGCVVLWKNKGEAKTYFAENREDKKKYLYVFTTLPIVLFVIFNLLVGISMLQTLAAV